MLTHNIKNSNIYYINLDSDIERKDNLIDNLKKLNLDENASLIRGIKGKELNNEGRYRASNHRNSAIKAFTNKTKNKEGSITYYITINEPASGIVKTFKISRDAMLKLNIEPVETPGNCVRNSLKTKSKGKSKKTIKKK